MEGNDGPTTELFSGWSSVVHQPEDEPEESDLPSTVDIGALSVGPLEPSQAHNQPSSNSDSEDSEADSSNSDGSDGSQESCSHSDSSDSESSSSSEDSSSRSQSPEFSVTSHQTNELRLTIATVRKGSNSPITSMKKGVICKEKGSKKSTSSSSSSDCSSDSDSDSDSKSESTESPGKVIHLATKGPKRPIPISKARVGIPFNRISKVPEKVKQHQLPLKMPLGASKIKMSSSSSSLSSKENGTRDKEFDGKLKPSENGTARDTVLTKSRVSLNANLNNSNTSKLSKDRTLPKLRSSSNPNVKGSNKEPCSVKLRNNSNVKDSYKTRTVNSSGGKDGNVSTDNNCSSSFITTNKGKDNLTRDKVKDGSVLKVQEVRIGTNDKNCKGSDRACKKRIRTKKKFKKMASMPLSRSSNYSSTDSDSSDELLPAPSILQEIRQEDLAAILPDQNECNDFNDFDQNIKDSPATGDLSGSDMELPQQAINSLIQRTTESSSDGEGHQLPNPQTLFANSLLQQFVPNTTILSPLPDQPLASVNDTLNSSKSSKANSSSADKNNSASQSNKTLNDNMYENSKTLNVPSVKRGRGRPRRISRGRKRQNEEELKRLDRASVQDFCAGPNVSPDSGIQNSPDHVSSPEPSLSPNLRLKQPETRSQNKTDKDKKYRNPSGERHSKRLLSQDRQTRHNSQEKNMEKPSRKNKTQDLSKRNTSQESRSSKNSQAKHSTRSQFDRLSKEKYSSGNSLHENPQRSKTFQDKRPSRNSSKDKLSSSSRNSSMEKVKETFTKLPITSNQLDRLIYANADRVLYPPRRKVGRPPLKKPGRPPKHKQENVENKNSLQKTILKSKVGKSKYKQPLNSKSGSTKTKVVTLKVPKILHSKHTHKHKKRKFKILKPLVSCDPKLNLEIEKLVVDFVKFCVITAKQPKENVPEQILKTLKKVTKKRRTTDHMEKKKKKQNACASDSQVPNSNEQRLPLKKRHYHLVSNSSENQKIESEESKDKVLEKIEKKEKTKEKVTPKNISTAKSHINNNEYEIKTERTDVNESNTHIEEAIEACINKFKNGKAPKQEDVTPENKTVTATTPKKRHRLENLNNDIEDDFSDCQSSSNIKNEVVCSSLEEKFDQLKSSITVESYINELKIKRSLLNNKSPDEDDKELEVGKVEEIKSDETVVTKMEKTVPISPESTKKKVRKRRAYNRTGFPTVKRKKKKVCIESAETSLEDAKDIEQTPECDRVPKKGEEVTKFLQRSSANNSMENLTNIDDVELPPEDIPSECESLPQDERIDNDLDNLSSRSESAMDNLLETKSKTDAGDNESLSLLETSIERLKSRLDQKKRKRNNESKSIVEAVNTYPKRRRREDSPASSIEPLENRIRDSPSASGDELPKKNKKLPRWRKKYLIAGLFSDYYKEDESKRQDKTRNLIYNPEEHPFGLMPAPYHCGKYLRCRKVDFQLPYDLWWQHTHSQLPGRDVVPSWNYRKIRTNVYNVKTNGGACEPQPCNCSPTSNCGDDCINRLVLAECPPSHRCFNQKIQKHDWAPGIEKFMTEDKGWGVRTKEPIKQGEFILEYVGEVVSDQEFKERMNSIYVNDTHHYCLHLDSGLVIDGHRMGGDGRFVNHSCEPNCEIQKWTVNGQFRMALFALKDIPPYEELTYDYNFSLFNPAEGQPCKCGSKQCRGVIGGKSQRVRQLPETTAPKNPGRVGRPRKTEAKKKPTTTKDITTTNCNITPQPQVVPQIQVKPMSHQQKCFIVEHHCFLLRNLTKVRKVRDRSQSLTSNSASRQQAGTPTNNSAFMNQMNALQNPRNIKTRKITQAEDDPELNKAIKLATILKNILLEITTLKDDNEENLSSHLQQLPSKRKAPEFYQKVSDAIDLATIEQNVATGVYKNPEAFDKDMNKLFAGFSKFYCRTSEIGIATAKLKKLYLETKQKSLAQIEDVLGQKPPAAFVKNKKKNEEEDIIRCICGIPRDEGLMIQCERCMVWQHIECVQADASVASYHCEICVPRIVDYEITMDDFTEHGHRYYMTLMRGELQLRQGDTVYVLRDIPISGTDKKHTYETIGNIDYSELDIFRIERLWKDKDTGQRFAYGHHYLRPHETFHEPTRKFFSNEVMRVPLYEAVPVELIMERCWVMDINTFCKGRPIGCQEEHVYICEYRVDKGAKMFSKVAKSKFPICTKSFAFEHFETRLKVTRTYCPHDVDKSLLKNCGVGRRRLDKEKEKNSPTNVPGPQVQLQAFIRRSPSEQKARLNKILLNLLSKVPSKQVMDVSYLLEGGRRRKKTDCKQ
ncbi:hypothetical protein ABEB36_005647 [Hypothenemus hampei]|uniref:Histone-lysine N-methyltransferase ash1 n=1 Tax=Hypothenemus hampei TaxID=57062 RepID=A0ABD1EZK8_HYPHA